MEEYSIHVNENYFALPIGVKVIDRVEKVTS